MDKIVLTEEELEYLLLVAGDEQEKNWFQEEEAGRIRKKLSETGKLRKNFDGSIELEKETEEAMNCFYESTQRIHLIMRLAGKECEEYIFCKNRDQWLAIHVGNGEGSVENMTEDTLQKLLVVPKAGNEKYNELPACEILLRDLRDAAALCKQDDRDKAGEKLKEKGVSEELVTDLLDFIEGKNAVYSMSFINMDNPEKNDDITVIVGRYICRMDPAVKDYRDAISWNVCNSEEIYEEIKECYNRLLSDPYDDGYTDEMYEKDIEELYKSNVQGGE